ncbi:hypothetical protein [[Kitasatospora] papulosa]|uniref:hypothetical protein n=1 Tax=[Kitasatospora] papulosa TaxID=1464011 RepID=UPI0038165832
MGAPLRRGAAGSFRRARRVAITWRLAASMTTRTFAAHRIWKRDGRFRGHRGRAA